MHEPSDIHPMTDPAFRTDRHTVDDLQLFSQRRGDLSVCGLFNRVESYGGRRMLEEMFRHPLREAAPIAGRIGLIRHLSDHELSLRIERQTLDFIEHYLTLTRIPTRISMIDTLRRASSRVLRPDNEFYVTRRGISFLFGMIRELHAFAVEAGDGEEELLALLQADVRRIIGGHPKLKAIATRRDNRVSIRDMAVYDTLFRYEVKDRIRELLEVVYRLDIYSALGRVMGEGGGRCPKCRNNPASGSTACVTR